MRSLIYTFAAAMVVVLAAAVLFSNSRALTISVALVTWLAVQPVIISEVKRARPVARAPVQEANPGVFAMAH